MSEIYINVENVYNAGIEINEDGQKIQKIFNNAKDLVEDLSKEWSGNLYSLFVDYYRNETDNIKRIIRFVKNNLPKALQEVTRLYIKADKGEEFTRNSFNTSPDYSAPARAKSKEIKFDDKIEEKKEKMDIQLNSAINIIKAIKTTIKKLEWTGENATSFKEKVKEDLNQIEEYLDSFKQDIDAVFDANLETTKSL